MIIVLLNDWFIEVDEKNYTLKQKCTNKKTGEPVEKIHGYYSTLDGVMKAYFKLGAIEVNDRVVTLQECVDVVKKVCDETIEKIKLLMKEE